MASHGTGASTSASTTGAVNRPLTFCAAAISRPNRIRNSACSASSARTIFTATSRPPGDRARNTRPIPPLPSRPSSQYGPTFCGSPGCSCCATSAGRLSSPVIPVTEPPREGSPGPDIRTVRSCATRIIATVHELRPGVLDMAGGRDRRAGPLLPAGARPLPPYPVPRASMVTYRPSCTDRHGRARTDRLIGDLGPVTACPAGPSPARAWMGKARRTRTAAGRACGQSQPGPDLADGFAGNG